MFPRFLSISLGCFALGALIAQGASAEACGTGTCTNSPSIEQFCFVGDGYLDVVGEDYCSIVFRAQGFPLPITATLSNYGEFSAGDRVHVEGCAELVFSTCMVGGYHISNNTIESTFPEPRGTRVGIFWASGCRYPGGGLGAVVREKIPLMG